VHNGPLTTGADSTVGTADNDTFNASLVYDAGGTAVAATSTLSAADQINGGAGTDTLNVTVTGGNAATTFAPASISNIENVFVRNVSGQTNTVDASSITGLNQLWNDRSTSAVVFNDLGKDDVVGIKGNGTTNVAATTFNMATETDAVSIAIDGGVKGGAAITNNGTGATTATISSSGAANTVGIVQLAATATVTSATVNANANLTTGQLQGFAADATLTITGTGKVTLDTLVNGIDTIDASTNTGGVTLVLDAEADTKFTGGSGNDIISTGAVLTTGSVDAGAGSDTLSVLDTTHITATTGAKYTNFETLRANNGVTVDLDNVAGITAVEMFDEAGVTALTDLSAAQAGAVTVLKGDAAATIAVKGAATVGQIDTVKMTFNDGDTTLNEDINTNASNFTLASIENLEVTAVDKVDIVQSNAISSDLTSVKLFGAGDISFTTGDMDQVNFSLDASASTGTNTLNAAAFATNGVSITGGTGADAITGSAQADVITGGAGNDVITGGDGTDTATGGAGADTFAFAVGDNAGADGAAVADIITDFTVSTDKLQFTGVIDVVSGQQAAVQTAVTALAAGSTNAQIATAMANANTTDLGVSFATFNGNTYAYFETTGATATHVEAANIFIQLSGVTTLPTFAADVVA